MSNLGIFQHGLYWTTAEVDFGRHRNPKNNKNWPLIIFVILVVIFLLLK